MVNEAQQTSNEQPLLTWKQRQFLAKRLLCGSDTEAAEAVGTSAAVVSRWKHEPEFKQAYEELPHDGLEFAKASHRQMLAKATMVHSELLDSLDDKVRLGAVKLLYEAQGLMVQKTEISGNLGLKIVIDEGPDGS